MEEADQDPDHSDHVIGIYTRRSIPKTDRDTGGNTPDAWNREHLWPRSHGFDSTSLPAHNDAHALRAADKSVNADRSDNDFDNGGLLDDECTECREGNGTWEPPNQVKGDIARAMLYMDVRYEGDDGVPDLQLVERLTGSGEAALGRLCTLIDWHRNDPVDAREMTRNDVVHSWQGNRNPFVDHPEWVLPLWGTQCGIAWAWPVTPPDAAWPEDQEVPLPPWAVAILGLALWGNNIKQRLGLRLVQT
jgi:endonuclease I